MPQACTHSQGLHTTNSAISDNFFRTTLDPFTKIQASASYNSVGLSILPARIMPYGRGGAGNIVRSRSGSREPRSRSVSRGPNGRASSLARMLNKVGIHGRHEDSEGSPSMTAVTEDGESAHTQE